MPTISKPCFCCGGCCSDGGHADLLPDDAMVTLPDIVPSTYTTCTWTTIYKATVKSGRKVGINPVFVNIGSSCDFGIWVRPKFSHACAQAGQLGAPCFNCVKDQATLGGELFLGWWCDGQPRGQGHPGYAPGFVPAPASNCGYVTLEWQVYTTYRPTSTSCTPPDPLTCGTGAAKQVYDYTVQATPSLVPGLYPLGSTGLFKVPRRCTWKLRYTNLVTMNLRIEGSFGMSNRNIQGVFKIGAYSQHPDCQGANSHSLWSSGTPPVIPGECTGPCVDSSAACCGVSPKCLALLDTPFWYPVGDEIASTALTNRNNPLPRTVSASVAVVGHCRCAHDQYFQLDLYYRIAGRA